MTSLAEAEVSERASAENACAESASAVCSQTLLAAIANNIVIQFLFSCLYHLATVVKC